MRLRPKRSQRSEFEIVVTSMLDINFLLIMFFMLTAQFQRTTHAPLELPEERGEENAEIDESGLVINLMASGEIIISNRTVHLDELGVMIREQVDRAGSDSSPSMKFMIRADRNASTQDLNRIVRLLRETGVSAIRIGTETPAGHST